MEQTSKVHLQNKAAEMLVCLEFVKMNIKSTGEIGRIANGKNKISKKFLLFNKIFSLSVIFAFFILMLYILL